ncbi:MAG: hypothetical protein LBG47_04440 [Prevotellaceae bacterium]|nr:hypothetical protein [Prevotellaceae bacterium]
MAVLPFRQVTRGHSHIRRSLTCGVIHRIAPCLIRQDIHNRRSATCGQAATTAPPCLIRQDIHNRRSQSCGW